MRARGKDKLQRGKSKGIRTEKKRERETEREREKTRKKKPYDRSVEGARKQRRGW